MKIHRATITSHDFFFYVSREIRVGIPTGIIHNTALMYAINTGLPQTQRNASGTKPHYSEDYKIFLTYATPAEPIESDIAVLSGGKAEFAHSTAPQRISYNSVDSTFLISMETSVFHPRKAKLAHPKLGSYMKYPPLTSYQFFTVGNTGTRVIRLGKKLSPAVLLYQRLEDIELKKGIFYPDHPVAISDLPEESKLLEGNVVVLPNGLVATNAKIQGEYYEGKLNRETLRVAAPRRDLFASVQFP